MKKTLFITLLLIFMVSVSVFSSHESITLHMKGLVPVKTVVYDNVFELEYDDSIYGVEVLKGAVKQDNGSYIRENKDVVISLNVIC